MAGPRARSFMAANSVVYPNGEITYECRMIPSGTIDELDRFWPDPIGMEIKPLSRATVDEQSIISTRREPIIVVSITPGGPVAEWNRWQHENGGVCVEPGDRLVAVNGHGDPDYLMVELTWQSAVRMDFRRPAPRVAG